MNSLIARVHVEMGRQEHNPVLLIYQQTDIEALVEEFVRDWNMPHAVYDKIYLEVVGELRRHGLLQEQPSSEQTLSEEGLQNHGGTSYTNSPIQYLKTETTSRTKTNNSDMYTPIHKLFPQIKGTTSSRGIRTPQSSSHGGSSRKLPYHPTFPDGKTSDSRSNLSFRSLVESRMKELYRDFMSDTTQQLTLEITAIIQHVLSCAHQQEEFICEDEFVNYAFRTNNAYRLYRLCQQQ